MAPHCQSIDGLVLEAELASNDKYSIFVGRREGGGGERVIVKVAHELAELQPLTASRLRREACTLLRFSCPALPRVLSFGLTQDGSAFTSYEFVTAPCLSEVLSRRGPLPLEQGWRLANGLLAALRVLHTARIAHGAVSSESIYVRPDADEPYCLSLVATVCGEQDAGSDGCGGGIWHDQVRQDLCAAAHVICAAMGWRDVPAWGEVRDAPIGSEDGLRYFAARLRAGEPFGKSSAETHCEQLWRLAPVVSAEYREMFEVPFVGRYAELIDLESAAEEADGIELAVVYGQPGMGKTRLLDELARRTAGSKRVMLATCGKHEETRALGAIARLFEQYLDSAEYCVERVQRVQRMLESAGNNSALLQLLHLPDELLRSHVGVPLPGSDDLIAEGLAEIVVKLLTEIESQLILAVDDFQWVDEASRRVLRRVMAELPAARKAGLLVVLAAREGAAGRLSVRRFVESSSVRSILTLELAPLTAGQIVNLVRQYFGREEVGAESEQALAFISDGSPLSVIQVIESVFDRGYLVPWWGKWRLNVLGVAGLQLPSQTSEILVRRVQQLQPHTREILRMAAILGTEFQHEWLRASCDPAVNGVQGLEEALAAQVLSEGRDGRLHFVHQSLREALLEQLSMSQRQHLHQQVLVALMSHQPLEDAPDEVVYGLAEHALGARLQDRQLRRRLCLEAGRRAHRSFDSARCIHFLQAVEVAEMPLEARLEGYCLLGEAFLRAGQFEDALAQFTAAADEPEGGLFRARSLARRAWIYESRFDSVEAWKNLEQAFVALGEQVPTVGIKEVFSLAWHMLGRVLAIGMQDLDERTELLCQMYLQAARLATFAGDGVRFLAATASGVRLAHRGVSALTLSRAYGDLAVISEILGWHERAACQLEAAREIAEAAGELQTVAHTIQLSGICACWRGDVQEALRAGAKCLNVYPQWIELAEYYLLNFNQQLLESLLGRGREAWNWIHRAGRRLLQAEGPTAIPELLYHAAYAAALNQGNERQFERLLLVIRECCTEIPRGSAFEVLTYGVRLRRFTEVYQFDDAFEALVAEFEQHGYNPRRVHLAAVEYYVHLAHARLEQALRLPVAQLPEFLPRVVRAVEELRKAARVPLVEVHLRVCRATLRVLQERYRDAEREFDVAQSVGAAQGAPWVLWAVFKGRAHLAQRRGQRGAMRDYAQLAVNIAQEHGAVHRAAVVRHHFFRTEALAGSWRDGDGVANVHVERERTERQFGALLRVGQLAARELHHEHQAREVLDETIAALNARRGFLWLRQPDELSGFVRLLGKRYVLMTARGADNEDLPATSAPDVEKVLMRLGNERVQLWDQPVNLDGGPPRTVMAARLVVNNQLVGVVSVEGPMENCPFSRRDADLLLALAGQATLVLELARALRDKDRLTDDLRHAQKMEAVGRLAGGMAHDFNNMIAAIQVAVDAAIQLSDSDSEAVEEMKTVRHAAVRSADVTRKLLAFSRRQVLKCRPLDLSDVIEGLIPTVQRLLGPHIDISTNLATDLRAVYADPSQLEQVLVNLAVNARDAMPAGGVLSIITRNRRIEANVARDLVEGNYIELEVRDTGVGMEERVRQRIFEPYFTTKPEDQGTGLGLSMAYGIVRQSGGDIAVDSRPGEGARFVILLPEGNKTLMRAYEEPVAHKVEPVSLVYNGEPIVLLVEDDALLRGALERTLTRSGFRVLAVGDGPAALMAARAAERVDVVVIDLILPEMNGLELARNLLRMGIYSPFLYMSGHADQLLTDAQMARADLLQKPMSSRDFVARVQAALARSKTAPKPRPRLRLISGPQR